MPSGTTELGSCLTHATLDGRSRRAARILAATLAAEHLRQHLCGVLTRWSHVNLHSGGQPQ
jgi:hypothetical protein